MPLQLRFVTAILHPIRDGANDFSVVRISVWPERLLPQSYNGLYIRMKRHSVVTTCLLATMVAAGYVLYSSNKKKSGHTTSVC
jgi:hypothetical protein